MKFNIPTQINKSAKGIFAAFLAKLENETNENSRYLKIDNAPGSFYPVTVEIVEENVTAPFFSGTGFVVSVAHNVVENGDVIRDPEVTFLVVDNRREAGEFDLLGVWPVETTMDRTGYYNRVISLDYKTYNPAEQKDLAGFVGIWFKNIKEQQELTPIKEKKEFDLIKEANKIAKQMGFPNAFVAMKSDRAAEFENKVNALGNGSN